MNDNFETLLDECLLRLRRGESLESCLADHPDQAKALRPLLVVSVGVSGLPHPQARPEAYRAGREKMLAAYQAQALLTAPNPPVSTSGFTRYTRRVFQFLQFLFLGKERTPMKLAYRLAIDLVIVSLMVGTLAVNASASSLPGDNLYGVKRVWEDVRLRFTLESQSREQLENQLNLERQAEIMDLQKLHRQAEIEYRARLERQEADVWTAGGMQFRITTATRIQGSPVIGNEIQIRARVQEDGTLLALEIQNRASYGPDGQPGALNTPAQQNCPDCTPDQLRLQDRDRTQTPDQLRLQDRDRTRTPDQLRLQDRDRTRTCTPEADHTPVQDRDRLQTSIPTHEPDHNGQPDPEDTSEPSGEYRHRNQATQTPEPQPVQPNPPPEQPQLTLEPTPGQWGPGPNPEATPHPEETHEPQQGPGPHN